MNRKEYFQWLGYEFKNRIRYLFEVDKGKIIDLIVQYESLIDDTWKPIVRYDCAHGFFHRDEMFADGSQKKVRIDITDLNMALNYAGQDLTDRWKWYKNRFLNNLKHD